jgi:hypothetical protein
MEAATDVGVSDPEARLGFSAQTLTYPEGGYELASLAGPAPAARERAVALAIDDTNRIRRRRGAAGYAHEHFNGLRWEAAELFGRIEDVAASDVYRRYAARRDADAADAPAADSAD